MKVFRAIVLNLLLLVSMLFLSTVVIWLMTIVYSAEFESIAGVGFKVGFVAYILLLFPQILKKIKKV